MKNKRIIYNVTTHVAHEIHELWLMWMQQKHIADIMEKGCFTHYQFVRLLETDETEGVTYAIQFYAQTMQDYERYISQFAPALREEALKTFGNKIVGFRSLMQEV